MKDIKPIELILLILTGIGLFMLGMTIQIIREQSDIQPTYYCAPDTSSKRAVIILSCMNNLEIIPTECEDIARRTYGVAGFKKGNRVFPCFKAETPEEKKACGDKE